MSAYRHAHATCEGHPAVPAVRTCCKCDEALCEPCCAFVVNEDVWCDTCGSELEAEGRGGRLLSSLAFGSIPILFGTLILTAQARWGNSGLMYAGYGMLAFCGVLGQLFRMRRMRRGPAVAHSPRIHRRRPGDALPKPRASLAATLGASSSRGNRLRV